MGILNIQNIRSNSSHFIVNTDTHSYIRSNDRLKFSERIVLLCKTIFQCFLNLFFNYLKKDQLQSQWREVFWGQKEFVISNLAPTQSESGTFLSSPSQISDFALPFITANRNQETINYPKNENNLVIDSFNNSIDSNISNSHFPKTVDPLIIPPSQLSPSPQGVKLSFQGGTSLTIPYSQLALLRKKSPYFKSLWSGHFQETLQDPLAITKKKFTNLLQCLMDANFKLSVEDIPCSIALAHYYQLTDVVENLENQLIKIYQSEEDALFNSSEESLIELKELLNFARLHQLNNLVNYLEFTVVSGLLNNTSHVNEFEKILNHFSTDIEELNLSGKDFFTEAHFLALKNCKNLKMLCLKIFYTPIDTGLAHLTSLTALQHLDLSKCYLLKDTGLAHLSSLTALQYLDLSDSGNFTDAGLAH
uniref:BTB/POZ domain-containing protein n=1 Tax=Candidatus Protochlamydia sp. R18 TaxID=1353977 RepID=UPI001D04E2CB